MERVQEKGRKEKGLLSLAGAGVAAVAASICCVGPLVLLGLGVSGAWIGGLTVLQPYRPIFITATLLFLAVAFYRVYRRPKGEACGCDDRRIRRRKKVLLWGITGLIFALLIFPSLTPYLFAADQTNQKAKTERVVLDVQNMTCGSCAFVVKRSLTRLDGVKDAKVTFRPPQAVVLYDPSKLTVKALTEATTHAGYPSTARGEENQ